MDCRICRGEGTPSQPLLHPCRCRGLIRYVHQLCLMEWLGHSNKSTKQCDICHTPYKFRTIYLADMPQRLPFGMVFGRLVALGARTATRAAAIALYFVCLVVQVPIYWKFVARVYTWVIDGQYPSETAGMAAALLYGQSGRSFLDATYFSGLRYVFVFIVAHLALFVEHEWVVRDEGYLKLLQRRIGQETKKKLIDMFQNALNGLRLDAQHGNENAGEVVDRIDMIARAIDDLRAPAPRAPAALWRRLDDNRARLDERDERDEPGAAEVPGEPSEPSDAASEASSDSGSEFRGDEASSGLIYPSELREMQESRAADADARGAYEAAGEDAPSADHAGGAYDDAQGAYDDAAARRAAREAAGREAARQAAVVATAAAAATEQAAQARREALQREAQREALNREAEQVAQEAQRAAQEGREDGDDNLLELIGLQLNVTTPIVVMLLCDCVISIYLFVAYLIPQTLGKLVVQAVGMALVAVLALARHAAAFLGVQWQMPGIAKILASASLGLPWLQEVAELTGFGAAGGAGGLGGSSGGEVAWRTGQLAVGWVCIALGVLRVMDAIAQKQPVLGTPRRVYKVLFEATCTAKVFLVFAIEIFFFPVYCGLLLDFCLAPLLLEQPGVLFSHGVGLLRVPYVRMFLYWATGTLYMLFFALFVGMVRNKILRTGTLFFIRSPDDPNARLIHDALMKPLRLQLSRIVLSGKVYTAFITVGLGGVTWGLRWCSGIFPIRVNFSLGEFVAGVVLISQNFSYHDLVVRRLDAYWRYCFALACHKLRLSHFILGRPIAQERGRVVYKSVWHQLRCQITAEAPDYARPVTMREARALFAAGDAICCFVPNGTYIRAPDNDSVSRRYVKKLFVSVTKDDHLLQPVESPEASDDEDVGDDSYVVVYRPPHLQFRCVQLVVLLWGFAVALAAATGAVALVVGRVVVAGGVVLENAVAAAWRGSWAEWCENWADWRENWGEWCENWAQWGEGVDAVLVMVGLAVVLQAMAWYETTPMVQGLNNRFFQVTVGLATLVFLAGAYGITVHKFLIDYQYTRLAALEITLTAQTAVWHAVAAPWTVGMFARHLQQVFAYDYDHFDPREYARTIGIARTAAVVVLVCVPGWWRVDLLPWTFGAYVGGDIARGLRRVWRRVDEEVRGEKFVRGRALENVD